VAPREKWAKQTSARPIGLLWIDPGDMNTRRQHSAATSACRWRRCSARSPRSFARIGGTAESFRAHRAARRAQPQRARKIAVRDSGVHVFTMKDIDRQGIALILRRRSARGPGHGRHSHLVRHGVAAVDCRCRHPSRQARLLALLMEIVADGRLLTSVDMVEVTRPSTCIT
jgi:arginase family enzyme